MSSETNVEVEQDLSWSFPVRKSFQTRIYFWWPQKRELLSKIVIFPFLCVYACVWVGTVCVSITGEKALTQIVCCGLSNLCRTGWGWDEGLIDRCCDWMCNPPSSLCLCVSPPTVVQIISAERTRHSAERLTSCLKSPDICLLQDELMVETWY